jgi:hypothetical protein
MLVGKSITVIKELKSKAWMTHSDELDFPKKSFNKMWKEKNKGK